MKLVSQRLFAPWGMERLLEALYKNRISEVDKTKHLEDEVSALRGDIEKLNSTLISVFNLENDANDQEAKSYGGKEYVS